MYSRLNLKFFSFSLKRIILAKNYSGVVVLTLRERSKIEAMSLISSLLTPFYSTSFGLTSITPIK